MLATNIDLIDLMDKFHSEDACRSALAEIRWPNGVKCPKCQGERHAYDSERYVWDCYSCGYQFSAMVGTIFQDTKLPLSKWFVAVLLMVEARKGRRKSKEVANMTDFSGRLQESATGSDADSFSCVPNFTQAA